MRQTISTERAERELLGRALAALRESQGMSQGEAGARLMPKSISPQAWQQYEAGNRAFSRDQVEAVTAALNATPEALEMVRAELLNPSSTPRRLGRIELNERASAFELPVWGRVRAGPQGPQLYDGGVPEQVIDLRALLGPSARVLRAAGDSMTGYVEPGELVIYDVERYPRRGYGCVIETATGEFYLKLYEKSDGSTLFVRELFPEERTITFALKDVGGIYAVRLRGD